MQEFDIPILKKAHDLYKRLYILRTKVPKQDRYSIFLKSENSMLETIEGIIKASQLSKNEKLPALKEASTSLGLFKFFIRLMSDVKTIDQKNYVIIEAHADEIGRMLGGWIKSIQS